MEIIEKPYTDTSRFSEKIVDIGIESWMFEAC